MADPTWVTNLKTRRDTICSVLAGLNEGSPTKPMDRPNKTGEGVHANGQDQKTKLLQELREINKTLAENGYADGEGAGIYESHEFA
jgi:hypothetical protein